MSVTGYKLMYPSGPDTFLVFLSKPCLSVLSEFPILDYFGRSYIILCSILPLKTCRIGNFCAITWFYRQIKSTNACDPDTRHPEPTCMPLFIMRSVHFDITGRSQSLMLCGLKAVKKSIQSASSLNFFSSYASNNFWS